MPVGGHADVSERVQELYRRCLQNLQPLLADMGVRENSNVLWSSATLAFNPDDAVPGMVHALTSRFPQFIDAEQEKQRPSAQAVANLVWALVILKYTPPDRLLDRLCEYMQILSRTNQHRFRSNAQDIANMLWGLAQLKHAPSQDVVTAVFDRLVALCHIPGLQPKSQAISNCLIACAELGVGLSFTYVEALLKYFMKMHDSGVSYQAYCNVAWSLAVFQCLDLNTFEAMLHKLTTKQTLFIQQLGPQSTSAQLTAAGASQLYQALAWLRPPSGSKQMQAWCILQSRLLTVAPEPTISKVSLPGQTVMWAALAMQEVPYKAQVQRGVHWADALLSPCDTGVAEVILVVQGPADHLMNLPSR